MRLYTRTGDAGETGLLGGIRLPKDDPRFGVIGTLDELNAHLGLAVAESHDDEIIQVLTAIQRELFTLGAYLAEPTLPERSPVTEKRIGELEQQIDAWDTEAGQLLAFILPGGTPAAAQLHVARAVCRRAERCLVELSAALSVDLVVRQYVNRLSDLLFAAARAANHRAGVPDVTWSGKDEA